MIHRYGAIADARVSGTRQSVNLVRMGMFMCDDCDCFDTSRRSYSLLAQLSQTATLITARD